MSHLVMPLANRRAPDLREVDAAADPDLSLALTDALRARHGAAVDGAAVHRAKAPGQAALAVVVLGHERRAHELFAFARGHDAADVVIDVLAAAVAQAVAAEDAFLPLDWEGRPYEGGVVFVRGEVRDYLAEAEAARLLGELMAPRAIPR